MLFTSYLYRRASEGALRVKYHRFPAWDWAVGLWFASPDEPRHARLLAETDEGFLMPLGLAPGGDVAVVWWLPLVREESQEDCIAGIYLLSTVTGDSRLLRRGGWWEGGPDGPGPIAVPDLLVLRDYKVPKALFSSDGRFVALAEDAAITIYRVTTHEVRASHVGACDDWAWSATSPTFVAGCESLTSAWVADVRDDQSWSVALPSPVEDPIAAEELPGVGTVGLTADGLVRVVRFYGSMPGCDAGCQPPEPQYAVTTLDPRTTVGTSTVVGTDFYVSSRSRLSPEASWVYAGSYTRTGGPHVIRVASGDLVPVHRPGDFVGEGPREDILFGRRRDGATGRAILTSLSRAGVIENVGSIGWAVGAKPKSPDRVVPTWGLVVASASD